MSISNIQILSKYISTSQAAYGNFSLDVGMKASLIAADFSEREADEFMENYSLVAPTFSFLSGFQAVVFQDEAGKKVLAIRGSEEIGQDFIWADGGDISTHGFAISQAVDLYRYWKILTTPAGQYVNYSMSEISQLYNMFTFLPNPADLPILIAKLSQDVGIGKLLPNEIVDVTGHSLGGNLAYVFASMFPANIGEVVTINAPGINRLLIGNGQGNLINLGFSQVDSSKITSVDAEGDLVHFTSGAQPGKIINISQEVGHGPFDGLSNNHSVINGLDGLNLINLFSKLDPSQTNRADGILADIMRASSNLTVDTYENMLDGLRRTLLGDSFAESTAIGNKNDIEARNEFYNNIDDLSERITNGNLKYLVGNARFVKASGDANRAKKEYSQFLSLYYLTPFVLDAKDSDLKFFDLDLYQMWYADSGLSEEDRNNGKANFSNIWYEDRAAMLRAQISRNIADDLTDTKTNNTGQDIIYSDKIISASPITSETKSSNSTSIQTIKFGSATRANTLEAGYYDDRLYGGKKADTLSGKEGHDYLEGGAGNDLLYGGDGADQLYGGVGNDELVGERGNDLLVGGEGTDTYTFTGQFGRDIIKDSSGTNILQVSGKALGTLTEKVKDSKIYYDDVDNPTIEAVLMDEGDVKSLLISSVTKSGFNITPSGNSVTIKNYIQSNFTFTLKDGSDPSASANPAVVNGTSSDNVLNISNLRDDNPSVDLFEFTSFSSTGGDGKDFITGISEGNDSINGGAGNDYISGGFTALLDGIESEGSADTDLIHGDGGNDWIFATQGGSIAHGDEGDDFLSSGIAFTFGIDNVEAVPSYQGSSGQAVHPKLTRDQILTDLEQHIDFSIENKSTGYDFHIDYTKGFTEEFKEYDSAVAGVKYIARVQEGSSSIGGGAVQIDFSGSYQIAYDYIKTSDGDFYSISNNVHFAGGSVKLAAGHTLKEFANLTGSTLFGDAGNDFIWGGMARDYLFGGADLDTIFGGYGNDVIDGGTEDDKLNGQGGDDIINGGDGNDTLWGGTENEDPQQSDNDWLYGGKGADELSGDAGSDYMDGGTGADKLFGGKGNDYLYGGDDSVAGAPESDYLDGGEDDDILVLGLGDTGTGGIGKNIYILDDHTVYNTAPTHFVVQYVTTNNSNQNTNNSSNNIVPSITNGTSTTNVNNQLVYVDNTQGDNTLAFAGAGGVSDLKLEMSSNGGVWVTTKNNLQVYVTGSQSSAPIKIVVGNSVEQLVSDTQNTTSANSPITHDHFLNGIAPLDQNTITLADLILAKTQSIITQTASAADVYLAGGLVNDTLTGHLNGTNFIGGKGDDVLMGDQGNDNYLIRRGDGNDTITEKGGTNTIEFDKNIAVGDVKVNRSGADLILKISDEQAITVKNMFDATTGTLASANAIQSIKFYNGTTWDITALKQQALLNTTGDDLISAFETADTLSGGKGNDQLYGGAGNDVYQYGSGDGNDVITDTQGTDIIELGTNIVQSQVTAIRDGYNNLILRFSDGGSIVVTNAFDSSGNFTANSIETIKFADNSTWNLTRLQSEVVKETGQLIQGTESDDKLVGTIAKDIFNGTTGNDQLSGLVGNDTYQYAFGDGNDIIVDKGGIDRIEFTQGVTQSNLVARAKGNDLILLVSDGGSITVKNMFAAPSQTSVDPLITTIIQELQTRWMAQSEARIEQYYGLVGGGDIALRFVHSGKGGSEAAYVETETGYDPLDTTTKLALVIDLDDFADSSGNGTGPFYNDRVIAHEMVHAIMATNMNMNLLPGWFTEGAAEFIQGADERVTSDLSIINDLDKFNALFKTTLGSPPQSAGYSVSYIAVKLLDSEIRAQGGKGIIDVFDQLKTGKTLDQSLAAVSLAYGGMDGKWIDLKSFEAHIKADGFNLAETILDLSNIDTGAIGGSDYGNAEIDASSVIPNKVIGSSKHFNLIIPDEYLINDTIENTVELIKFADGSTWDVNRIQQEILKESLIGSSSSETITGTFSAETIIGNKGNDQLIGLGGDDVYQYNLGDGNDTITDSFGYDRIKLGSGISVSQVKVDRDNSNNLVFTFNDGGSIAVANAFDASGNFTANSIESVVFADSNVWTQIQIKQLIPIKGRTIIGTSGGDNLIGDSGNDTLIGGKGLDGLHGGQGDDTYVFNLGDEGGVIYDSAGFNTILLGTNITQQDVKIWRNEAGYENLVIDFGANGDRVVVADMFDANTGAILPGAIGKIQFADNSVWDLTRIKQEIMNSTGGDDLVWGFDSNDTLTSGGGNDSLIGWAGDDTYVFNLGDGVDTVIDWSGTDTIEFGVGIDESQVQIGSGFGGAAEFLLPGDQKVVINHMTDTPTKAIEFVRFANGAVWDSARIKSEIYKGSDSSDSIIGTSGDDLIGGGKGNDELKGGLGNDTYIFNRGNGVDQIIDNGGNDTINFGPGITSNDLIVYRDSKNLYFLLNNGEMIEVLGNSSSSVYDNNYAIENIVFANGETWDAQKLEQKIAETAGNSTVVVGGASWDELHRSDSKNYYLNGLEGDDDITGGSGNDTLVGGAGLNFLDGGLGGDTYLITEESGFRGSVFSPSPEGGNFIKSFGENDRILFAEGVAPGDVSVRIISGRSESRLEDGVLYDYYLPQTDEWNLEIKTKIATVYILDIFKFDSNHFYGASLSNPSSSATVEFSSGEKWSMSKLLEKAVQASENDDFIIGAKESTIINGLGGDDTINAPGMLAHTLIGGAGNDTIGGGKSDDMYQGGTGNDLLYDESGNDVYQFNSGDGVDRILDSYGKDQILFGAGITKEQTMLTPNGNDLEVTFNNSSDKLIIVNGALPESDFYNGGHIEYFKFANGDVWDFDEFTKPQLKEGDEEANDLRGGSGNDTIIGHGGNDVLFGDLGNDTYEFDIGDGLDSIGDADGIDKILLGPQITPSQTRIYWASDSALVLLFDDNNSITIYGSSNDIGELSPSSFIEAIHFSNNEKWDWERILSESQKGTVNDDYIFGFTGAESINGGAGNDWIRSYSGNDTLVGGTGGDQLIGGLGDDVYRFNLGDGTDLIAEEGGQDTIEFLSGILPSDVTVSRTEYDLILKVKNSNPITVVDFFSGRSDWNVNGRPVSSVNGIESILFTNGTRWSLTDILSKIPLIGTSGANALYGYLTDDLLDGLGGNDTIYADSGNDTLKGGTGNDVLKGELGNDLLQGGDGNDQLDDIYGSNVFQGGKGDDELITAANAVVRFGLGDGVDSIYGSVETVELGTGITASMLYVTSYYQAPSDDSLYDYYTNNRFDLGIKGTADKIKGLYTDEYLKVIKFADGSQWDSNRIIMEYNKSKATLSADRTFLTGTTSPNAIVKFSYLNKDNSVKNYSDVVADASGNYRLNFGFAVADPSRISITKTDENLFVSTIAAFPPPLDLTAPSAPSAQFDDTGFVIFGFAKPGAYVDVYANGIYGSVAKADIVTGAYSIKLNNLPAQNQLIDVKASYADISSDATTIKYNSTVNLPDSNVSPVELSSANFDSLGAKISGIATPGAFVYVMQNYRGATNEEIIGYVRASTIDGSYTVNLSEPIIDGRVVYVRAAGSGNTYQYATYLYSPDLTRPLPAKASFDSSGKVISGEVDWSDWNSTGGIIVTVKDSKNLNVLGSAVTKANDGTFKITLASAIANSDSVNITVTDLAGNTSYATSLRGPDKTAPTVTSAAFDASGRYITGIAEAGSIIIVKNTSSEEIGIGVANLTNGAYTVTLATPLTRKETVRVTARDSAGNVSSTATSISAPLLSSDTTPPNAPTASFDAAGKVVSGSAEAGSTISIKNSSATEIGSGIASLSGTYSITLSTALINKETVTVTAKDTNGNTSPSTSATTPLLSNDTTAPSQPSASFDATGKVVSGSAEAGSTISIKNASLVEIGNGTANSSGIYSITLSTALLNKETVNVTARDSAGNISVATSVIAPDLTAPSQPSATFDTTGKIVSGNAEAGSTVSIKNASAVEIGSGTAISSGTYSITLSTALINKETVSVTAKDAAGNMSVATYVVAPDLTAPSQPTASFDSTGKIVSGNAEAGSTVSIKNASSVEIGSGTAASSGTYSITLGTALTNKQVVSVIAKDAAGNISSAVSATAPLLSSDTTAPNQPTAAFDSAGKVVSGSAEAGSTVSIKNASAVELGSGTATSSGAYSITLSTALINKEAVNVTAKDAAGNVSVAISVVAPDLTAPSQPTASFDSAGKVVSGSAEAGSTVSIKNASTVEIGSGTATSSGTYLITLSTALINKETVNVTARDSAGNVSVATSVVAPDLTAPSQPTASFDSTGKIASGNAEAGSTVSIKNASSVEIGSATATSSGTYSITLSTALINKEAVNVTAKDAAGNVSVATSIIAPDLTAPSQPSANFDSTGKIVSGTAEAGSTISIKNASSVEIGSGTATSSGTYLIILSTALINKETVNVTAKDAAGNVSIATSITAPDLTAPPQPTASFDSTGKVVSGSAEAGSTVSIKNASSVEVGSGTANSSGIYSITLSTALINKETVNVTAKDAAGNISVARSITAPDLTAPSQPTASFDSTGKIVSGSAEAGSTVSIKNASSVEIGNGTANSSGAYSITLGTALINKETVNVTAKDAAGNVSVTKSVTAPDLTAPSQPTASFDSAGKVVSGSAEAGSTVSIKNASSVEIGSGTANSSGAYSITLSTALVNKETVNVMAKDAAGNVSVTRSITAPDLTAPSQPTASFDSTGKIVSGNAEAGSTISIKNSSSVEIGSGTATSSGTYSITLGTALTNKQVISVTAKDAAGNISSATSATAPLISSDTTAPNQPTASFNSAGKIVSGTAEAGSTISIRNASAVEIGSGTATSSGTYSITLSTALINKETVNVTAKDAAGNVSVARSITAPDLTAPSQPTASFNSVGKVVSGTAEASSTISIKNASSVEIGSGTATSSGTYSITLGTALINKETVSVTAKDSAGNVSVARSIISPDLTAPSQPTASFDNTGKVVSGTAEASSTISIKNASSVEIGSGTTSSSGTYSITLSTALINKETANVTAKDSAGNVSTARSVTAPDLTAPSQPTASFNSAGKIVSGTAEAGSTISIKNASAVQIGSGTATSSGTYSITLGTALINKEIVNVTAKDSAGNISVAKSITAPDLTAPSQPTASFNSAGKILSGTAEANSTVSIKNASSVEIGSGTTSSSGTYSITLSTALVNKETVKVTAKDAAGNISAATSVTAPLVSKLTTASKSTKTSQAVTSSAQADAMVQAMASFAPPASAETKPLVGYADVNPPMIVVSH